MLRALEAKQRRGLLTVGGYDEMQKLKTLLKIGLQRQKK